MERPGEKPLSVCDELAIKFNGSLTMSMFCLAWIGPAVSLVWVGFASVGIRSASRSELDLALDRIQAGSVLLAIFGFLIGLRWAARSLPYLPAVSRIGSGSFSGGLPGHVGAAVVSLLAGATAVTVDRFAAVLLFLCAASGFYALLFVSRWLLRAPMDPATPLALFAAVAAFRITIGWLHVLHPTGLVAPAMVAEGLFMAWVAIASARVVATVARTAALVEVGGAESSEPVVSPGPAQQSLPGPAVGR